VKEGEEGKGRERRVWGWALALSVSGRRTHLNTPSFGNGSTPLAVSHRLRSAQPISSAQPIKHTRFLYGGTQRPLMCYHMSGLTKNVFNFFACVRGHRRATAGRRYYIFEVR